MRMLTSPLSLPLACPPPPPQGPSQMTPTMTHESLSLRNKGVKIPCFQTNKVQTVRPVSAEKGDSHKRGYFKSEEDHPDLRKTRMCPNHTSAARCPLSSDKCKFAHSNEELRVSYDRYYKVQPCAFFDRGKCRNGEYCRFAHGPHELRVATPSGSVAPTSATGTTHMQSEATTPAMGSRAESPMTIPQASQCSPLGSASSASSSMERGKKTFDLASFLSSQRCKRQSLVSFVGSKHSRRKSDTMGRVAIAASSASTTPGIPSLEAPSPVSSGSGDTVKLPANMSPDGSPLGGRSTGFSSAWSDCSPLTFVSSDGSPARLSVASSWGDNVRSFPVMGGHIPPAVLSAAIHSSLTSIYRD
eukprot:Blabericola_migrator_1__6461@NODE_325_length_9793_cov_271_773288_g262_i0_p3_GENE_NODE_325_length_9793_cov_271_773288_g262_i0NODE_325_length_9793_cov_271_773288_g262_i0_p3_ORF_typecomplete_len358_score47_97zfCCCH/PF00642_24/0_045zfCCCH/PF00642_24/7_8e07zfCCCH_4/PF18044_1/38zfCCCH_4/PF18044_1/0_0002zfCCCH_4/PF18044_1/1_2e04zfCCCH_3/PF15663_5/8_9zfCCCH_3/PF15663_5/0_0042zf_CCCH_4/PF18345_1/15zf_CCCH_4/PF18345_1/0_0072Torus/PF16131_5/0_0041zfCCCH_2/PF14608_6/64zfCCCH_2/PF14608_6/1_8MGC24/PF05283_11/